jgi:O-Antigen ligase
MFAGIYPSSLVVPAILLLVLLAAYRPWRKPGLAPLLHLWFRVIAGAIALQLVPLPPGLVDRLSPADRPAWQALSLTPVRGALPLSIDLASTVWALGVCGGALLVFVISRKVFQGGGVRIVARGVATVGLLLAAECLAQDATGGGRMYWRWKPLSEGAPPFGPFVNRNHFATWVVIAAPLCIGYLLAHTSVHRRHEREIDRSTWHKRVLGLADARSLWLGASICLMLVALVASLSRAGMAGFVSALLLGAYLRGRRTGSPAATWAIGAICLAGVVAALRVNLADVFQHFGTVGAAATDRLAIWRATWPVVKDFWLTGAGAGTFETAMLVYERTPSLFRINAAHNHYLQVAAEGGLLIGIPVLVAIYLFVQESLKALADDDSGMYFLRAGALCGLAGVAVQSLWETGLTTPANAVLAALAAAIVVHRSAPRVRSNA